jgi:hypothetical protein
MQATLPDGDAVGSIIEAAVNQERTAIAPAPDLPARADGVQHHAIARVVSYHEAAGLVTDVLGPGGFLLAQT